MLLLPGMADKEGAAPLSRHMLLLSPSWCHYLARIEVGRVVKSFLDAFI